MNDSSYKNLFSRPFFALALIILTTAICYSNIYQSPFIFDDSGYIVNNNNITKLNHYLLLNNILKPRNIINFTFALNYRFGNLDVFGYHLFNVLVHMVNGLLVYFLALIVFNRLVALPGSLNYPGAQAPGYWTPLMSLFAALIFVLHPIQTQAVTYTVQRFASMATLFYLLSVLLYLKGRLASTSSSAFSLQPSALYALSFISGMFAFLSKPNTASLPAAILLVEYFLIDRTLQDWKRKLPWFALVFTLWILFILYVMGFFTGASESNRLLEDVSELSRSTEAINRWHYLCTQFNVLVIYIRLLFLPIGQNLDYMYPFKKGFFDGYTPLAFLFLLGLVCLGIKAVRKHPVITFAIFWFFITLSVESSIIPISDALYEHRLYLPMFGFALLVPYLVFYFLSNRIYLSVLISVLIISGLGAATVLRNVIWQDPLTLWSDVVSKSPHNFRGHNGIGLALDDMGRIDEAICHYKMALEIEPNNPRVHNNMGIALMHKQKLDEAITHFSQALRLDHDNAEALNNMGVALKDKGMVNEAIENLSKALEIDPENHETHNNLGAALTRAGRYDEAMSHFFKALRIKPDYPEAYCNMGGALKAQGRFKEAINHCYAALKLKPDYVEAYNNIGVTLEAQGNLTEAINFYTQALSIDPDNAEAHNYLGGALVLLGRLNQAIGHYTKALRLWPDYAEAHNNLGVALGRQGKHREAVNHFLEALRIKPGYTDAKNNLKIGLRELAKSKK